MALPYRVALPTLQQPLVCILSHSLQQTISDLIPPLLGNHQGFVHQRTQQIQYFAGKVEWDNIFSPILSAVSLCSQGWPSLRDERAARYRSACASRVFTRPSPLFGTDELRRFQSPATCKHRQLLEQLSLRAAQQIIAPVNEPTQRLLARQGGTITSREQVEPVVE